MLYRNNRHRIRNNVGALATPHGRNQRDAGWIPVGRFGSNCLCFVSEASDASSILALRSRVLVSVGT